MANIPWCHEHDEPDFMCPKCDERCRKAELDKLKEENERLKDMRQDQFDKLVNLHAKTRQSDEIPTMYMNSKHLKLLFDDYQKELDNKYKALLVKAARVLDLHSDIDEENDLFLKELKQEAPEVFK